MTRSAARRRNLAVLGAVLIAAWQALYWIAGEEALTSPAATFIYTGKLVATALFWSNLAETMTAFTAALALAVGIGLVLGVWLGSHRPSGDLLTPILVAFASVPKIVLYPIVLLTCGLGMSAKIVFGAMHGIPPIALSTLGAVGTIRPVLLKLGRVLRLGQTGQLGIILLPAALPEIMTGLRIGFSLTLIGTILGEMFASQQGLGYLLMTAIGLHDVQLIMSVTLILAALALTASALLLAVDRRLRQRF